MADNEHTTADKCYNQVVSFDKANTIIPHYLSGNPNFTDVLGMNRII